MTSLSETSLLAGASGQSAGYLINQSIRFNDNDSPQLKKTFSSAGTEETFTFSCWFKRGNTGPNLGNSSQGIAIFSGGSSGNYYGEIRIDSSGYGVQDSLHFYNINGGSFNMQLVTTRLFRDPSAWYHIVCVMDTTQAVASERMRIYVNGARETSFSTETYPSQNLASNYNTATEHGVGVSLGIRSFEGYFAEVHFLDGYAYGPEYFGKFTSDLIWVPIEYSSSYGSNGFYLKGSNSGSLGADSSGNGNNFTSSGLAANDQKTDTPTNNMITFNPLNNQRSGGTVSNGNLDYVGPGTRTLISLTANIPSTGKWAIAFKVAQVSTNVGWQFGITKATNSSFGDAAGSNEDVGASDGVRMDPSSSDLYLYDYVNSTGIDPSLPLTTSDEFWIAVDMATGKVFLGIYDESATAMKFVAADTALDGNPATGDNPTATISDMIGSTEYTFAVGSKQTSQHVYLQRSTDVSGTTPSGYTYFENVKDIL